MRLSLSLRFASPKHRLPSDATLAEASRRTSIDSLYNLSSDHGTVACIGTAYDAQTSCFDADIVITDTVIPFRRDRTGVPSHPLPDDLTPFELDDDMMEFAKPNAFIAHDHVLSYPIRSPPIGLVEDPRCLLQKQIDNFAPVLIAMVKHTLWGPTEGHYTITDAT